MNSPVYNQILENSKAGKKQLAVLIDPDKFNSEKIIKHAEKAGADYFFVGGSLLTTGNLDECVEKIKSLTTIPVVLFPGNVLQVTKKADALLLLSLISGRNPEMLIGNHVVAAPQLKMSRLEIMPTGYMLIESGKQTTVSYMSNTTPIPSDKNDVALCTAMAGEMLGLKIIYMDAGSGAKNPVPIEMIKTVKQNILVPLIIGGGIRTGEEAYNACVSGADVIVIGNAAEKNPILLQEISNAIKAAENKIAGTKV